LCLFLARRRVFLRELGQLLHDARALRVHQLPELVGFEFPLGQLVSPRYTLALAATPCSGEEHTTAGDGPCRDRTCDLGIKSPLLYQLS
jgi:hypothetical protein